MKFQSFFLDSIFVYKISNIYIYIIQQVDKIMEPKQIITLDKQQWQKTLSQLKRLKQQNQQLKEQVQQYQQRLNPNGLRGRHSLTQSTLSFANKKQQHLKEQKLLFKTQMGQWLKKINQSKTLKIQRQNTRIQPGSLAKIDEQSLQMKSTQSIQTQSKKSSKNISIQLQKRQMTEESPYLKPKKRPEQIQQLVSKTMTMSKRVSNQLLKQKKQIKLIQSICLYGPNQQHIIEDIANRKMLVGTSLLYSSSESNLEGFKVYGEYFYPQGQAAVRSLREDQVPTQINQIIFRKNTKKQDCSVFLFRGDENNQQLQIQNVILSKVNPGKWLLAFFVQFSDFQALEIQDSNELPQIKINKSVDEGRDKQKNGQNQCGTDRAKTKKHISTHYVKSKYTLCIFTYFPLINVMEQLLSSILDEIKIKRFQKFADGNQMKDVSIKFFIKQLGTIGKCIQKQIQNIPPSLASNVEIRFGTFSIMFDMSQSKLDELLFSGWVYDVLKIFDKDVIYDLFTNMMTEQSLCFVSENMHLLTYVIFFFVCIMPFPFTYPHPCISKVFNYELLESPFVVTAGINQSSKWLEQNITNYPKKIFIDLNDQSKVKGKKKPKNIKSQKLKKIFNTLYKKIQVNTMPQIFKKKQTIIRPATRQQNQSVITFIKSLQVFYSEQIFSHLPNPAIISFLREKIEQKNQTSKIFNILKQIEKYLKQSRRHKQKDHFIDLLVQQQIFYVHMGSRYALD